MKKITNLCLVTCALAITNNSSGMLKQKSLIHALPTHKKIQSFHTHASTLNPLDILSWEVTNQTSNTTNINNDLLKKNNTLLHEIIKQNKENNDLLRIIIEQNQLLKFMSHNNNYLKKLNRLCDTVEKKYNIKLIYDDRYEQFDE